MNKKYIAIMLCASFILFAGYILVLEKDTPVANLKTEQARKGVTPPSPAWTYLTVSSDPGKATTSTKKDTVFTEAVKKQMADISEAFEENMRYPTYSKPLHKNDWTLLNPRAFIPKSIPLEELNKTSAEIIIPRFIVTRDETIPLTIKVISSGIDAPQVQEAHLYIGESKQELSLQSSSSTSTESLFNTTLKSSLLKTIPEKDVILSAELLFDDFSRATVSTIFKLVSTQAILESLSSSYVENADLVIPANFSVEQAGHYRVQANLFDKATLSPISHLNNSFKLETGRSSGLLKVHAETLRSKGFPGPYLLKDINITRSPATPGDQTGYGSSKQETFDIQGYDLDSYSRETYQDKHSQQRLQFLQKMAGLEQK